MAAAGKSRFAVTCALLRRYMRENRRQAQMSRLLQLFEASSPPQPPPPAAALEEHDDRTMQLFPVRAAMAHPAKERPETKKAPMTIFYEVRPREEKVLMRTASLQRFLKKRKLRTSDTKPGHREDSTPSKKQKDAAAAAGEPFQDVTVDPSWLRL